MAAATLLISRQPLQPCGQTPWVRATAQALRWVKENGHTLISSVGMPTWELITALAATERVPLRLILASCGRKGTTGNPPKALVAAFGLDPRLTTVSLLTASASGLSKAASLRHRDESIVRAADILIPIAINPDGNMATLLATHSRDKTCIDGFHVAAQPHSRHVGYRIAKPEINPLLAELDGNFLFHWTRTSHGPWPDESPLDYYRDIVNSRSYPRSAYATLRHIIAGHRIIASPWRMPDNIPTVSFSACAPAAMAPLMRWRSRYRRMSFEPYAVGVRRKVAEYIGIRPVRYYHEENPLAASDDIWLSQSVGNKTDWRHECECRHRGDLDLAAINADNLVLITRTPSEAERLSQATGLRVYSFTMETM